MTYGRVLLVGLACLLLVGQAASATELSVMMGLGELEWRTMRDAFPTI